MIYAMFRRSAVERLKRRAAARRLLVLTGARQVGKTTLVQRAFPELDYVSFDDPAVREQVRSESAQEWLQRRPRAVLDEVQKAPAVLDTVKAVHDATDESTYVLLGSSQLLLMDKVTETLAGRAAIEELWPLTLPELATASWDEPVRPSRLLRWLMDGGDGGAGLGDALAGVPASSPSYAAARGVLDTYLVLGGMPAVYDARFEAVDRREWLRDYRRTYLERDVRDLANLRDLEPFTRAQHAIALRTGGLLNFADLANVAGVSGPTAKRFVRYLELSYQAVTTSAWNRNPNRRLAKAPKVHVVDPGVARAVTGRRGPLTGPEFESAVVSEVVKQVRTAALDVRFHHLRTYDGREVDLLLELAEGYVAVEVKQSERVADRDGRHLRALDELLDKPVLGRLLLSRDRRLRGLVGGVLAAPVAWVLGAP